MDIFTQESDAMLVLSRKLGERILIGENIELTIVGFRGRTVVLGLEAPRNVVIRREELGPDEFGTGAPTSEPKSDAAPQSFRDEFDVECPGDRRVFPVPRSAVKGPLARSLASVRPKA
jgi:carbon storage regulator